MAKVFPFSAIVGQSDMKLAMMIAAVDRTVGGVLLFGDRGTGKSTAVRALAGLLPRMRAVVNCPYSCAIESDYCDAAYCGSAVRGDARKSRLEAVPVVDLPLGVTEDRVVGALDIEKALVHGEKAFDPGLLARANRGFLYIDEINLLEDHIVDLLLDVAASGENVVEREGLSVRHPSRFVLIGSGNPEEGELRPQLIDRFGLAVDVRTTADISERIEVIRRRDAFERGPDVFSRKWSRQDGKLRRQIVKAREALASLEPGDEILGKAAEICISLETDGSRGELTLMRAARAYAALQGDDTVSLEHLKAIAPMALGHRLRRDPLDESSAGVRVQRVIEEQLP